MALVSLPSTPGPVSIAWSLVDFGGTLAGPLGGTAQRVNRLGNRWRITVTMPLMTAAQAREWAAALVSGLRNGVSMELLQPGSTTGSPGTVLVAGADQSGTDLDVDGMNPGYPVRASQWLNVLTGGRRYLYMSAANVSAGAGGTATLAIEPPLRAAPADNDPVELGAPVIEGLLAEPPSWGFDPSLLASGFTFTIEESA